jgi:UDPglucose--hexose-1-phosphate uridylyltransferase
MNGVGAHEIIAETARHDRNLHELEIKEISDVIRAYLARIVDLEGDKRVRSNPVCAQWMSAASSLGTRN